MNSADTAGSVRLPAKLYVSMEEDGEDGYFPLAATDLKGLPHGTKVGVYKLQETKTVTITTELL